MTRNEIDKLLQDALEETHTQSGTLERDLADAISAMDGALTHSRGEVVRLTQEVSNLEGRVADYREQMTTRFRKLCTLRKEWRAKADEAGRHYMAQVTHLNCAEDLEDVLGIRGRTDV